ncbi:MAG: hypothetical protein HY253_00005, partial [Burkholderiales bacterium]|nr:hypothetical protein [Burkholderiales bacterium]
MGYNFSNIRNISIAHKLIIERIVALGKSGGYSERVIMQAVIEANIESQFNVNAGGVGPNSPQGLFQYKLGTWSEQFTSYANAQNALLNSGHLPQIDEVARVTDSNDKKQTDPLVFNLDAAINVVLFNLAKVEKDWLAGDTKGFSSKIDALKEKDSSLDAMKDFVVYAYLRHNTRVDQTYAALVTGEYGTTELREEFTKLIEAAKLSAETGENPTIAAAKTLYSYWNWDHPNGRQTVVTETGKERPNEDCSGLVQNTLRALGYNIGGKDGTVNRLTTRNAETGGQFDVVSARTDIKPGDVILMDGHMAFVESYNPVTQQGTFYGSQNSTGPATTWFTTKDGSDATYWKGWGKGDALVFLRPKESLKTLEPTFKVGDGLSANPLVSASGKVLQDAWSKLASNSKITKNEDGSTTYEGTRLEDSAIPGIFYKGERTASTIDKDGRPVSFRVSRLDGTVWEEMYEAGGIYRIRIWDKLGQLSHDYHIDRQSGVIQGEYLQDGVRYTADGVAKGTAYIDLDETLKMVQDFKLELKDIKLELPSTEFSRISSAALTDLPQAGTVAELMDQLVARGYVVETDGVILSAHKGADYFVYSQNLLDIKVGDSHAELTLANNGATYAQLSEVGAERSLVRGTFNGVVFELEGVKNGQNDLSITPDKIWIDGKTPENSAQILQAINESGFEAFAKNNPLFANIIQSASNNPNAKLTELKSSNPDLPFWEDPVVMRMGKSLSGIQNLIAAVKSHDNTAIAAATLSIANNWTENGITHGLSDVLGVREGYFALKKALERGDKVEILRSSLSLSNDIMSLYKTVLTSKATELDAMIKAGDYGQYATKEAATAARNDAVGTATDLGDAMKYGGYVLSVLSIYSNIKNENYLGAFGAFASMVGVPVIGWVIAVGQIMSAILRDTTPYGTVSAIEMNGKIIVRGYGDNGGYQVVEEKMTRLIEALQENLKTVPNRAIVASRLPWISFDNHVSDCWTLSYIDAKTGKAIVKKFDAQGRMDSHKIGDENIPVLTSEDYFMDMGQAFLMGAVQSSAIVTMDEYRTIKGKIEVMRTQVSDEDSRRGEDLVAPINPNTVDEIESFNKWIAKKGYQKLDVQNASTQVFRPIVLDLNGDGIKVTKRDAGQGVLFDVDGDGYAEETDWIDAHDAILVMDVDDDGEISSAEDLFNDSRIDTAKSGLEVLWQQDSDNNGKLNASDVTFSKLRAWRDLNRDGAVQKYELQSLSELGVTSIDYRHGIFTRNGQDSKVGQADLTADVEGVLTDVVDNLLIVKTENSGVETF